MVNSVVITYPYYREVCLSFPDLDFYLAPTTSRSIPTWFTSAQPFISKLVLEQVQDQQTRILPLPGFTSDPSDLEPDGVHFLSAPGMRYCMHLIDSARFINFMFCIIFSLNFIILGVGSHLQRHEVGLRCLSLLQGQAP